MLTVENEWKETSIFITVKTYPTPSKSHRETVCTAGITDSGEWVRLYPLPYRYLDHEQQFAKYCWIQAKIRPALKDHRPDSFNIDVDSLKVLEQIKSTPKGWTIRNGVILPTVAPSLEYLKLRKQTSDHSLGIFKPAKIIDMVYVKNKKPGSSRLNKNELLDQSGLLDAKPPKVLEEMPYNFYFIFDCDDDLCPKNHEMMIIDWEVFVLFRRLRNQYGEDEALRRVRDKYMNEVCAPNRDTHFIVGTDHRFGHFLIIGIYWPKAEIITQVSLRI